jgi:hypothetical protein
MGPIIRNYNLLYRKTPNNDLEEDKEVLKKKKHTRKRRKNPLGPKQPMSAYNFFVKEKLEVLRKILPDYSQIQLMKYISKSWKDTSDRSSYIQKAEESKKNYEREKSYVNLYHKPNKVKKPMNAFILYMRERTKNMSPEEMEKFHFKPKKREKKETEKVYTEKVLLSFKTGEVVEDNSEKGETNTTTASSC